MTQWNFIHDGNQTWVLPLNRSFPLMWTQRDLTSLSFGLFRSYISAGQGQLKKHLEYNGWKSNTKSQYYIHEEKLDLSKFIFLVGNPIAKMKLFCNLHRVVDGLNLKNEIGELSSCLSSASCRRNLSLLPVRLCPWVGSC